VSLHYLIARGASDKIRSMFGVGDAFMQQTPEDLEQHLREEVQYLHNLTRDFDGGFEAAAKKMAGSIRLLVHDTRNSKSLLGQLGLLDIPFYDTAPDWDPSNLLPHQGLVSMLIGTTGAAYSAPLDIRPPHCLGWSSFQEWWNKIVIVDPDRNKLTRMDVVLAVADRDGGAHVDPNLKETYAALSRQRSIDWTFSDGTSERPIAARIALVSIRQITHEVLTTLARAGYPVK
jgi:hypothetical protein